MRRRFEQNQEDCTFTVLALLPTATEDILVALPVENITHQLQQKKAERTGRSASAGTSEVAPSEMSSGPPSVAGDDGKSLSSFQSEGYIHASQMAASSSGNADMSLQTPRKSKAQLWNEVKIKCASPSSWAATLWNPLTCGSYHKIIYASIYSISTDSTDANTTQLAWPEELLVQCGVLSFTSSP